MKYAALCLNIAICKHHLTQFDRPMKSPHFKRMSQLAEAIQRWAFQL